MRRRQASLAVRTLDPENFGPFLASLVEGSPSSKAEVHKVVTASLRRRLAALSTSEHAALAAARTQQEAQLEKDLAVLRAATQARHAADVEEHAVSTEYKHAQARATAETAGVVRQEEAEATAAAAHAAALHALEANLARAHAAQIDAAVSAVDKEARARVTASVADARSSSRAEVRECEAELRLRTLISTSERVRAERWEAATAESVRAFEAELAAQRDAVLAAQQQNLERRRGEVVDALGAALRAEHVGAIGAQRSARAALRAAEAARRDVDSASRTEHALRRLDDDAAQAVRDARRALIARSTESLVPKLRSAVGDAIAPLQSLLRRVAASGAAPWDNPAMDPALDPISHSRESRPGAGRGARPRGRRDPGEREGVETLVSALVREAEDCSAALARQCLQLRLEEKGVVAAVLRRGKEDSALIEANDALLARRAQSRMLAQSQ